MKNKTKQETTRTSIAKCKQILGNSLDWKSRWLEDMKNSLNLWLNKIYHLVGQHETSG